METVKPKDVLAQLYRQGFRCAYTGDPLTPEETGADHIQPVSRGGGHAADNMALVTRAVNTAKGALTLEEFREMCGKVVRHLGELPLSVPLLPPAEDLAGCTDPVEILTRLGYPTAADEVRVLQARAKRHGKRSPVAKLSFDELNAERQAILDGLQAQINQLRAKKCSLRYQVAAAERANDATAG